MSTAASSLVSDFRITYPDCSTTNAYVLLNEIDKIIQRLFRHKKKWVYLALEENERGIDLSEEYVWVVKVRYVKTPQTTPYAAKPGVPLDGSTEDAEDTSDTDWDANSPSDPCRFMQGTENTQGQLVLDYPALNDTLAVSGATNATPIVVSVDRAHGLEDGDRVDVRNVLGNTAANGELYAKVTGYSTTTFALYSDSDLATAVAGNGVYTSGGLVGCADSEYLLAEVAYHETLDASSTMELRPFLKGLYVEGMKFEWAKKRHKKDIPLYKQTWEDVINEQDALTFRRAGRSLRRIRTFRQRPLGYVPHTRF